MEKATSLQSEKPRKSWWSRRKAKISAAALIPIEGPYFVGSAPFVLLLVLVLIGTFATGFLTYRHVALESQTGSVGESVLCRADGKINCDAILLTDEALLFGYVPSATLGLMGSVFALWLVVNALINQGVRKLAVAVLVLYFFAAIGFSWYFIYLMVYEVPFICTWCIVAHVVNFLCLAIVLGLAIMKKREFLLPEISSVAERTYFVAAAALISLFVFASATLCEKALSFNNVRDRYEELANDPAVILAMLRGSPTYEIPISSRDPIFGSRDAPYAIILFSDFQCPICSRVEGFLRKLVAANRKKLCLVYKNYPLSSKCNHTVLDQGAYHPEACDAARAAGAAFLLGGSRIFWAYGDLLFRNRKQLSESPWLKFAKDLKLDENKFKGLLKPGSPADLKLKEDVNLGIKLRLAATPQIFFQGKKLPENFEGAYFVGTLEQLVRAAHPEEKAFRLRSP